jgi:hypothetical protein
MFTESLKALKLFEFSKVGDLYIDTRIKAPYDVGPKHVPLLHRLNNKDPLPKENEDYVIFVNFNI